MEEIISENMSKFCTGDVDHRKPFDNTRAKPGIGLLKKYYIYNNISRKEILHTYNFPMVLILMPWGAYIFSHETPTVSTSMSPSWSVLVVVAMRHHSWMVVGVGRFFVKFLYGMTQPVPAQQEIKSTVKLIVVN